MTAPQLSTSRAFVPWKARDVGIGLALALAYGVVLVVGSVVAVLLWDVGSTALLLGATGLLGVALLVIVWLLGPGKYRASLAVLGLARPTGLGPFVWAAAALGASLAFNLVYTSVVSLADNETLLPPKVDLGLEGPWVAAGVAMLVLWGPFTEEIFFRGFVFAGLVGRLGVVGAATLSALLFGLAHGNVGTVVPAIIAGLLLALLYYRTRSLWACFAAHAAQNALALSVLRGA